MIKKFLESHKDLNKLHIERALYILQGDTELFIFEEKEYNGKIKNYIFVYDIGYLTECQTEFNNFNSYFTLIPNALEAEYITF